MRKLKSFTLIELLIVIVIIAVVSVMSIKMFSFSKEKKIEDLYSLLYPNGKYYIKSGFFSLPVYIHNPKVYYYYNNTLKRKYFINNQFEYKVKNGVGESFLLVCDEGIYLFKPFKILKFSTVSDALNYQKKLIK